MTTIQPNNVLSIIRNDDEVFVHADLAGLDFLLDRLKRYVRELSWANGSTNT